MLCRLLTLLVKFEYLDSDFRMVELRPTRCKDELVDATCPSADLHEKRVCIQRKCTVDSGRGGHIGGGQVDEYLLRGDMSEKRPCRAARMVGIVDEMEKRIGPVLHRVCLH